MRRRQVWLACALGHKACRENLSVLYQRMPRLFAALALARGDGRYAKLLRAPRPGRSADPRRLGSGTAAAEQQRDLLEIVEDRYDTGSLIITSQLPIDRWYEIVGNPTLADAILDRIIHNAHRIELAGESLRKLKAAAQAEPEARPLANEVPRGASASASTPAKAHRK